MSSDGHITRLDEPPFLPIVLPEEHPMSVTNGLEVFLSDPLFTFLGMSSGGPTPEGLEDCMVDGGKKAFTDDMAMVLCPSPDDRIELSDELPRRNLRLVSDKGSHLIQEPLAVLLGRFDEQFLVVFADILTKKVKSIFDSCEMGFLGR
jgi:hypothetical protein